MMQTLLSYLWNDDDTRDDADLAYQALVCWSHVWQVASQDSETPLDSFCNKWGNQLIESLTRRVVDVYQHPHEATLALQSLNALCGRLPSLRQKVPRDIVEQAEAMGTAHHAALAQASHQFLQACS
jgi:hypothetical protein